MRTLFMYAGICNKGSNMENRTKEFTRWLAQNESKHSSDIYKEIGLMLAFCEEKGITYAIEPGIGVAYHYAYLKKIIAGEIERA